MSVTQCKYRNTAAYDLYVTGDLAIHNLSNKTIIVTKNVDVVFTTRIATSEMNARNGKFLAVINSEFYFGTREFPEPTLDQFITIKPHEAQSIRLDSVEISASAKPLGKHSMRIGPGRYWIEFGLSLLPEYFEWKPADVALFREKWSGVGQLVDELVVSDPFPLQFKPDPNSPDCTMR